MSGWTWGFCTVEDGLIGKWLDERQIVTLLKLDFDRISSRSNLTLREFKLKVEIVPHNAVCKLNTNIVAKTTIETLVHFLRVLKYI